MSLIVLNSKGSDPEDFSNFMTEQIKFPKNAEVCLVSSNINRKMMVESELQIAAGSNTFGLQIGHGNLAQDGTRALREYTPHAPYAISVETEGKNFPIGLVGTNAIQDVMNAACEGYDKHPVSNVATGWANVAQAGGNFTFFSNPQVIRDNFVGVPGSNWVSVQGTNAVQGYNATGGINSLTARGGTIEPEGGDYAEWKKLKGRLDNNNFVNLTPVWNTHTGARKGVFNLEATNRNVNRGSYNWRWRALGNGAPDSPYVMGGLFDATIWGEKGRFDTNKMPKINKLCGGNAYTVWWEQDKYDPADGSATINFYARKPGGNGLETKNLQDQERVLWASVNTGATPSTVFHSVGIRPVLDTTGAHPTYCLEAYYGKVVYSTNQYTGGAGVAPAACADNGTSGFITIQDPMCPDSKTQFPGLEFDLYRHLPLYMGCNTFGDFPRVLVNCIEHDDSTDTESMVTATGLNDFSPYHFLFEDINPVTQALPFANGGSWDSACRQMLRKATIGPVLGFNTFAVFKAAVAMLPTAEGAASQISIGLVEPERLNLVVTLPDLPITGYYGNSSGDGASGTLNINSGGNSGAIIGVIPSGDDAYKDPTLRNISDKGKFYACPMENWICLNNPTPFSVSSLRCRLTDALGNKPRILNPTTTIVIKIKKRGDDVDYRQGGMDGVYNTY